MTLAGTGKQNILNSDLMYHRIPADMGPRSHDVGWYGGVEQSIAAIATITPISTIGAIAAIAANTAITTIVAIAAIAPTLQLLL